MKTIFGRAVLLAGLYLAVTSLAAGIERDLGSSPRVVDVTGNPNLIPLKDYIVITFDRTLAELRTRHRFGIYRDDESRERQWIEEAERKTALPAGDRPFSFLALHYEVPAFGSHNGWWMKLDGDDWNEFRNGSVVLRLRLGQPCTRRFKMELKAMEDGIPKRCEAIVHVTDSHLKEMAAHGFSDVAVPMRTLVGRADLSHMDEIVIVFENRQATAKKGDLLIHSIRLKPPRSDEPNVDIERLLDQLARRAFSWFESHRDPRTGLVLDRGPNSPRRRSPQGTASIASAGYYLSMLPEAVRTGQIGRDEAEQRAGVLLAFAIDKMKHHHGLLHHFVDVRTGEPIHGSEVSCLDSAIFFNGCIVAAEAFGGPVRESANALINRADWNAFVVKHPTTGKKFLSLGWKPREGLLGPMDVRSSEMAMACCLAVGSPTHAIDPQCWYNAAKPTGKVAGRTILNPTHPLFTSYYGLAWHDLRGLVDKEGIDLERNARDAAMANRDFCRAMGNSDPTYAPANGGWWGISAGDSPEGYVAPGPIAGHAKGTVWPVASLAAVTWAPEEIKNDLDAWRKSLIWPIVSGTYGLAPFNLDRPWVGRDLIGIDLGSFYLNLANHRNNTVRELWMKHPVAKSALSRLAFRPSE